MVSIMSLSSPRFFSLVSFFGDVVLSAFPLPPFLPPLPGDCERARVGLPVFETVLSSLFLDTFVLN